jgi:hypothetical protein
MTTLQQKNVVGLPCLICDAQNTEDAALCCECAAPMALVHDAVARDRWPQIVSVVGSSNVGKTVYLGFLLDMLSQRAGEFEAVPKGAFSVDLQQTVISYMAHRVFPPKTPMEADQWYWAHYQVCRKSRNPKWIDLVMPDMAGESLAAEISTPKTFRVINSLLSQSAGTILLVDAAMAANGSTQPDFFGLKILSHIDSIRTPGKRKEKQRIKTPTAVVLCKGDYCPEVFDDPPQFVKANLNRLWNLCESRFERVKFFACSVVGSLGYATSGDVDDCVVPVPLHTALQGVLEPFDWLVDQL